jgi:TonB family protein
MTRSPATAAAPRLGRYTLLRPLGAGGMAELFLARADGIEGFSKLVALKRILPHKASNERFVRMFLNEARLVAGLDHPNIAQVYDIGQEDGDYFFAMEYVHGPDLRRILQAAPGHRLQLENVLHVAIGLCAGLHRAHEARDEAGRSLDIVHRDVSPSNVLVSYQGAVKLVDFGVAKAATIVSETHDGIIKGKYGYMSPEQCLGDPLTRQSDVFNVGILLWEMTVGRRLYKINGDLVTLQRIVYVDAPPPSRYVREYPPELERIVMRALSRDPVKRYQTAEQLQLELERFALDHRIPVSAVSMGLEMRQLFRERIEAWQQAQQAGRSLADHLAEVSSDHAVSSQGEADGIEAVIGDLEANQCADALAAPTHPGRRQRAVRPEPEEVAPVVATRTSAPDVIIAPPSVVAEPAPRRSRTLALAALLLIPAAACVLALLLPRAGDEPAPSPHTLAVVVADPVPPGDPVPPSDPAPPPGEAAPPGEPGEPAAETEVPADEPDDAREAEPDTEPAPSRTPAHNKRAPKPTKHVAKPVETAIKREAEPRPVTPDATPAPEPPKQSPAPVPAGPRPGTVDPSGVRSVARAHLGEIATCVSRARMDNRDLAGRVVVRIDVSPTGRVTNTAIASSTGASATLESCISRTVASWTFPAPAGGVRGAFTYPFTF